MDRKSLLYASAGVAVLALLAGVLTYSGGGLNPQTQAGLATADQLLNSSRANYRELSREARSLIDSMTGLPQPRREQWLARLARSEKDLDSASSELDQAKELAAQDDDKLRVEIESRIGQARQKRTQALQAASEILDLARTVSEVDKNRGRYIGEAQASVRQLSAYRPASVPGAQRAMIDWPEKKADLSQAIQRMAEVKARSASLWKERSRAIAAPDADALLILETHQSLQADGLQLARLDSQLGQRVGQLYLSWDRVLVDMEIREGEALTLLPQVQDGDRSNPGPPEETGRPLRKGGLGSGFQSHLRRPGRQAGDVGGPQACREIRGRGRIPGPAGRLFLPGAPGAEQPVRAMAPGQPRRFLLGLLRPVHVHALHVLGIRLPAHPAP